MKSCVAVSAVLVLVVLGSGCVSRHSYAKRQFVLEANRPDQPAGPSHDVVLAVRGFTIDPVCDSLGLLCRKGESEYESDFYNQFLVAPQALISSQTRAWLTQSGKFKTVLEPGSLIEATYILEGNVLALYGDFRGQGLPQAVMQIRVFAVANKASGPQIAFARDYRASREATGQTAEALVAAFNQCLEQILTELETDLGESL
jgi:cholesterol transport system auxiliary component